MHWRLVHPRGVAGVAVAISLALAGSSDDSGDGAGGAAVRLWTSIASTSIGDASVLRIRTTSSMTTPACNSALLPSAETHGAAEHWTTRTGERANAESWAAGRPFRGAPAGPTMPTGHWRLAWIPSTRAAAWQPMVNAPAPRRRSATTEPRCPRVTCFGTGATTGGGVLNSADCSSCSANNCAEESGACWASPDCTGLIYCMDKCPTGSHACIQECIYSNSAGAQIFKHLASCLNKKCNEVCVL